MFKELFSMMGKATISLTIAKTGANELTVGIIPKSEGSEMVPATIVGSPEELDAGFTGAISGLVQDTEVMILKKNALKASTEKKKEEKQKTSTQKTEEKGKAGSDKNEKPEEVKKEVVEATLDLF